MVAFSFVEWLILGLLILIAIVSSGIWSFIKIRNIRWNFNYVVWETINGADKQDPTKKGLCRLISIGDQGEEVYYLKELKKYRVAYGKKRGKNTIDWCVGNDGLWYNIEIGGFNKNFKTIGLIPVDRDIRYATTSVRKLMDQKYRKLDATTRNYLVIMFIILIVGIGINAFQAYITVSKQKQIANLNNEGLKIQQESAKLFNDALSKIDLINSGGPGYQVVP